MYTGPVHPLASRLGWQNVGVGKLSHQHGFLIISTIGGGGSPRSSSLPRAPNTHAVAYDAPALNVYMTSEYYARCNVIRFPLYIGANASIYIKNTLIHEFLKMLPLPCM